MRKLNLFFNNILLINFCLFLFFAPYSKQLVKICFCVGIITWLLLNILKYKKNFYRKIIPQSSINKTILFFLFISLLSVIFSSNIHHSLSIFFERYLPFTMFFWMALGLVSDKISEQSNNNLYILILIFLISGIFLGIGGIRDYFLFHPTRLFTVFSKEIPFHMLGLYLVYFIPFSYVLFFLAKGWFKYLSLINLVFLVPCLVWHSSRAVWISVIFSLLITTLCYKKRSLILFLIIFVILYSLLCYINPISFTRIKKIFEPQDRLAIMSVAIKIFKTSPLLGSGLGMYEKLFSKYYEPPVGYEEFSYLHAHNTYLEILSEIGILGILAFLWIFLVFFKNAFKSIKNIYLDSQIILYGLIGSLIATLILAFFGSIILVGVQESSLFWFLFGLASGLISKGTVPGEINY